MSHKNYNNYNKMSQSKVTPNEENEVITTGYAEIEPVVKIVKGVVTNCTKLNLRAEPNSDAEILCELPCNTEVEVNESASTEKFYKVCTATGMEGYCMKDYIVV